MKIKKTALILFVASLLSACATTSVLTSAFDATKSGINTFTFLKDRNGCYLNSYGRISSMIQHNDHICREIDEMIISGRMTTQDFRADTVAHNKANQELNSQLDCQEKALRNRRSSAHCPQGQGTAVTAHGSHRGQQHRYTDQQLIGGQDQPPSKGFIGRFFK